MIKEIIIKKYIPIEFEEIEKLIPIELEYQKNPCVLPTPKGVGLSGFFGDRKQKTIAKQLSAI